MNQSISVTGTGTVAAPPDLAIVNLGVDVIAPSVGAARRVAAERMTAMIAALRENGIAEGAITTTAYTIHPEYDHRPGGRVLRGYRVSNSIEVRIEQIEGVAGAIDAAGEAGSEHVVVHGLRFIHRDRSVLEAQARARAWKDASDRATQLAELAGVELGPVVGMSEQEYPSPIVHPMRAIALESASSPIEAGELAVTVVVHVEFGIG